MLGSSWPLQWRCSCMAWFIGTIDNLCANGLRPAYHIGGILDRFGVDASTRKSRALRDGEWKGWIRRRNRWFRTFLAYSCEQLCASRLFFLSDQVNGDNWPKDSLNITLPHTYWNQKTMFPFRIAPKRRSPLGRCEV